jgi:hypothetical protein
MDRRMICLCYRDDKRMDKIIAGGGIILRHRRITLTSADEELDSAAASQLQAGIRQPRLFGGALALAHGHS